MENVLGLIAATAVLVAIPGPNVALIVAQSLGHGLKHGLATVFATILGVAGQLLLVVAGLAALLGSAAAALAWIKWLGVAYLVWLGFRTWRERPDPGPRPVAPPTIARTMLQGSLFALLNPKTLLFNAAFLPQFLGTTSMPLRELALLAGVYLTVILIGDLCWAFFASAARGWLVRLGRWRHRIVGGLLMGAGVGLAIARHDG